MTGQQTTGTNKFLARGRAGFTLIETFVAITILLIAVLGPMSMIAKFYASNAFAGNQLTASFLAQDGLETTANIIRNNKLRFNDNHLYSCAEPPFNPILDNWLLGLAGCTDPTGCNVDALTNLYTLANSETDGYPMYKISDIKDNDYGFYSADPGPGREQTRFYRVIKIKPTAEGGVDVIGDRQYLRAGEITSTVGWREKGGALQSVKVKMTIMENLCR